MEDLRDFRVKYRPKTLDEVWGNEHIKMIWNGYLRKKKFPQSIILNSNFGTGKTTLAKIFMSDIIKIRAGNMMLSEECIEFDPTSYESGDTIRLIRYLNGFACKPFAYSFDEAQRMSEKIQESLLRIIEDSNYQTYVFATTELDRIDKGIQSRSDKYDLMLPSPEILSKELERISALENIKIDKFALEFLIEFSGGIPRECLGNLQILSLHDGMIDLRIAKELLVQ